jgi:pimeloyl-ACP methyl ester carboxylesterase
MCEVAVSARRVREVNVVEPSLLAMPWGHVEVHRGGQGPALVVLHRDLGNLGWGDFHDALARDYTVWAPSLPGFGASDLPDWARTVTHVAALTGHVLDRLGFDAVHLVGLGWGGWVAAELAAVSPKRVRSLALVSPMGIKPDQGEVVDQFLYSAADYALLGFADAETFTRLVGQPDDELVAASLDRSRETVTRVAWKPIGHDRALPGLLACVSVPALVVWGEADAVVPATTARQWSELLGVEGTVLVAGAGHHAELEYPEDIAGAVHAFLSERDALPAPNGKTGGRTCS